MPYEKVGTPPPPKRPPAPRRTAVPAGPSPEKIRADRTETVGMVFEALSFGSIAANRWDDAAAFKMHGPGIAKATAEIAEKYEGFAKILDSGGQFTPFTGLLAVALPLLLQLGANHNKISSNKAAAFGVQDPEMLAGKFRLETTRHAAEQVKAFREERQYWEQEIAENERIVAEEMAEQEARSKRLAAEANEAMYAGLQGGTAP